MMNKAITKNWQDFMWRRHRHPISGWSRFALAVLLGNAIWHHNWWLVGLLLIAIATNPFWTPPPKRDDAFMTRAIDGERIWLSRASTIEKILLMVFPGMLVIPLIWALFNNHAVWTAFFSVAVLGQKIVFLMWTADIAGKDNT